VKFPDKQVKSVGEFLTAIRRYKPTQPVWYRGQPNASWDLTPTIARAKGGITAESTLFTRFKQNAMALLQERPSSEWEWLFIMRHHGVPTRLLDWSESPLVGLFFAVSTEPDEDGAVWSLLPIDLNKLAGIKPEHPSQIPGFGDADVLDTYLPSTVIREHTSSQQPAAGIAPRNTRRMQAQHGVFTITHREQLAIESLGEKSHVWRVVVPKINKPKIIDELASLNISTLALFPELDHVANHAKEIAG